MGAAELVNMIRNEVLKALKSECNGFELATVIAPFPDILIKVDNMKIELSTQDLIVSERLVKSSIPVCIKSEPGIERTVGEQKLKDSNTIKKNTGTITAKTDMQNGHLHGLNELELSDVDFELSHVELKYDDTLKVGDRVLVQAISGGQKYILIDRVVE